MKSQSIPHLGTRDIELLGLLGDGTLELLGDGYHLLELLWVVLKVHLCLILQSSHKSLKKVFCEPLWDLLLSSWNNGDKVLAQGNNSGSESQLGN